MEAVAVDHPAVPQREHLDRSLVAVDGEPDDVDAPDRPPVGCLPLAEMPDGVEAVSVARRLLEALVGRCLAHALLELALDRVGVPGEELDDAVDDLRIAVA